MGYTAKIKSILKMISLFVAGIIIHYGAFWITLGSRALSLAAIPIPPDVIEFHFTQQILPGMVALLCALPIVVINCFLYWRARKKRKQQSLNTNVLTKHE
ncbi:MAG: hypothetical protein HWN80_18330 [Candidatus Lokiarchaeota archaeon]|nr:hypothetical protein [Candidatus Lokiarchaeota archaeon]